MLRAQKFAYADESVYENYPGQFDEIAPPDPVRDFSPPEIKMDPVAEPDQDIYSASSTEQPAGSGGFQIAGFNGYLVIVLILVLINFVYNYFNK